MSLFTGAEPIGIAQFNTYRFDEGMFTETFVLAADSVSQELYDFSEGLAQALKALDMDDGDWIDSGTCVVEFKRLVMRAGHAGKLQWVAPVREFIRRHFQSTHWGDDRALVLCPFPLEFEGARSIRLGDEALDRRRRAMVRLYERTLGVALVVPVAEERLWMARSLARD